MKHRESGQALVFLLVIMVVAITITTAAVIITLTNSQAITRQEVGQEVFDIAETGAENALLRLLRDPNFAGETFEINGGVTMSTVSGTTTKTVNADGKKGNFTRKIQVVADYNSILSIISWKEIGL